MTEYDWRSVVRSLMVQRDEITEWMSFVELTDGILEKSLLNDYRDAIDKRIKDIIRDALSTTS